MTDGGGLKVAVRFYTRAGCHLCDEARSEMLAAPCRELYDLEMIDIDTDPELVRRYGWDVPVVTINGSHAFKHRLTREDFESEIRLASKL